MAQIKQLKDTTGNFYPVTHKDAIVGIEDIQVDMSGKVDVADFEEATLVTSAALNTLNLNLAAKESDILLLLAQVLELQNLISTLMGSLLQT